jgi:hypothetical protein
MVNPDLDETERVDLVGRLMAARPSVRDPRRRSTARRRQPRTWPSTKSSGRSANAVRRSGTTARRISTGIWRRTLGMLAGTRAVLASAIEDCELPKAAVADLDGALLDSVDLHAIAWQEENTADRMAAVRGRCGETSPWREN